MIKEAEDKQVSVVKEAANKGKPAPAFMKLVFDRSAKAGIITVETLQSDFGNDALSIAATSGPVIAFIAAVHMHVKHIEY